jgi:hypothetical protein
MIFNRSFSQMNCSWRSSGGAAPAQEMAENAPPELTASACSCKEKKICEIL